MNWDRFFLGLAEYISTASKDPSTKTGAVIVGPNREVISVGYNGFARGVMDLESRYADRETKYKMIVHCESNAIILARRDLTGCTIYLHPFMPCAPCAGKIIQAGIKRVVAPYNDNPRWQADFRLTEEMLSEAVVKLDLIKESK